MQILSVEFITPAEDGVRITFTNGDVKFAPWPIMDGPSSELVDKWLDSGNNVTAYTAPPPETQDQKIDRAGEIFIAFLKAYAKREGLNLTQVRDAIKAEL